MKTITAILEKGKDGYGVSFDGIPNVYGFGETAEAAKADALAALESFVKVLQLHSMPIPAALQGKYELDFIFDASALLEYIGGTVTQAALAKASGIAPAQLSHYATRRKRPRPEQRSKIVAGLHTIAEELLAVS
ncbi:MAG: type II toxin-antitoxin system HicB family antitoxin [Prevotellaceae bacterium]|jgi:predicted RNase H-like HicB family nuclease|nr:type II toxin-antitoxin system HicB family antitoxin [Prevotellaceae bacterium]